MTSGGQCVVTTGTTLMLLWSASNWAMKVCYFMSHTKLNQMNIHDTCVLYLLFKLLYVYVQGVLHTAMPTLALEVDQSSWMMSSVPQVPANY